MTAAALRLPPKVHHPPPVRQLS